MYKRIYFILSFIGVLNLTQNKAYSQVDLESLLTESQWEALFPKRAGTYGVHPQGYTTDFYSYDHLQEAINNMADYFVEIKLKSGVWGQLINITKKSSGLTYNYSDVDPWWHSSPVVETIIHVDFADFLNTSSLTNNKRELAAFLANISKETTGGWVYPVGGGAYGDYASWGLYWVHELGYTSGSVGGYSIAHTEYPPNPLVSYHGRGPIQLSWNYNYGQFSKFLFNDKHVLLNNPNMVQNDGVLAFQSAIWFWMMPQCPKPSCHQVMHDLWVAEVGTYSPLKMYKKGFAHTNNIINGGLECRPTSTAAFTEKVVLRSDLYKHYLGILAFTPAQIALEDTGDYTTLCYESSSNTMTDYLSCEVNAIVLSVLLTDFQAQCQKDHIQISWTTINEQDVAYYTIQRSEDAIEWLDLAHLDPKGTNNQATTYVYKDKTMSAQCYYRLKETDFNNKIIYHHMVSANCELYDNTIALYPNPAKTNFTIALNSQKEHGTIELRVYDLSGQMVGQKLVNSNNQTLQVFDFDCNHLKPGTYIVKAIGNHKSFAPTKIVIE